MSSTKSGGGGGEGKAKSRGKGVHPGMAKHNAFSISVAVDLDGLTVGV